MQINAPFKERLIRYRTDTDAQSREPELDPELIQSIKLGALAGFAIVACAVTAFMLAAGYL